MAYSQSARLVHDATVHRGDSSSVGSERIEAASGYIRAGRKYAALSDAALRVEWILALNNLAADPGSPSAKQTEDEFCCEFFLRGQKRPLEAVAEALKLFLSNSATSDEVVGGGRLSVTQTRTR